MTKISGIGTTETAWSNVDYIEGERADGTSVKVPRLVARPVRYHQIPLVAGTIAVNSTSYAAFSSFNFFLDRDTFPATHFRIVIRGSANEAAQTVKAQLAAATAPGTPLHTGGDDVTVTNTNGTFDSGWRTFDDGGSGLLFGNVALKGSNGTVDLVSSVATVMFKH